MLYFTETDSPNHREGAVAINTNSLTVAKTVASKKQKQKGRSWLLVGSDINLQDVLATKTPAGDWGEYDLSFWD